MDLLVDFLFMEKWKKALFQVKKTSENQVPNWKKTERGISTQLQAWKNRQNLNVYEAFSEILGSNHLWTSIDRYGIMRPTLLLPESGDEPSKIEEPQSECKKNDDESESKVIFVFFNPNQISRVSQLS